MTDQPADYGLTVGDTAMESVGPIAFGPGDMLFIADNQRAKIVAIDVADPSTEAAGGPLDVEHLDSKLAAFLGCATHQLAIRDLAVHPRTGNAYLSVMRGMGEPRCPCWYGSITPLVRFPKCCWRTWPSPATTSLMPPPKTTSAKTFASVRATRWSSAVESS